jgi:hypothetical protein
MLSPKACEDLAWIDSNLQWVNGAPVWWPSRVVWIQTNASSCGWGAWVPEMGEKARGSFVGVEASWPIHCKELLVAVLALKIFCPKFPN